MFESQSYTLLKKITFISDDAFFQSELGWSVWGSLGWTWIDGGPVCRLWTWNSCAKKNKKEEGPAGASPTDRVRKIGSPSHSPSPNEWYAQRNTQAPRYQPKTKTRPARPKGRSWINWKVQILQIRLCFANTENRITLNNILSCRSNQISSIRKER